MALIDRTAEQISSTNTTDIRRESDSLGVVEVPSMRVCCRYTSSGLGMSLTRIRGLQSDVRGTECTLALRPSQDDGRQTTLRSYEVDLRRL